MRQEEQWRDEEQNRLDTLLGLHVGSADAWAQATVDAEIYLNPELREAEKERILAEGEAKAAEIEAGIQGTQESALGDALRSGIAKQTRDEAQAKADELDFFAARLADTYGSGWTGQFEANFDLGRIAQEQNDAWDDYYKDPTAENRARAQAYTLLDGQVRGGNAKDALAYDSGAWGIVTETIAGYIPQFIDQTKAELKGGLAGAAVGLAATFLTGGIFGTTLVKWGYRLGATAGSTQESFGNMRGAAFRDLMAMGVDENVAREAANNEAYVAAAIEGAETFLTAGGIISWDDIVGAFYEPAKKFGMKKLTAKLGQKMLSKLPAKMRPAAQFVAYAVGQGMSEYAEEYLQEGVSIANKNRVVAGEDPGSTAGLVWDAAKTAAYATTHHGSDEFKQMNAAGWAGFVLGGVTGGVKRAGGSTLTSSVTAVKAEVLVNEAMKSPTKMQELVVTARGLSPKTAELAEGIQTKVSEGQAVPKTEVRKLVQAVRADVVELQALTVAIDEAQSTPYNGEVVTESATVMNPGASEYVHHAGTSGKAAAKKAAIVQDLIDGKEVSDKDLRELNLHSLKYREVFTKLTGVEFPDGVLPREQLNTLARSAKDVAQETPSVQNEVQNAETETPSVQNEVQNPVAQEAVAGYGPVTQEQAGELAQARGFGSVESMVAAVRENYGDTLAGTTDAEIVQKMWAAYRAEAAKARVADINRESPNPAVDRTEAQAETQEAVDETAQDDVVYEALSPEVREKVQEQAIIILTEWDEIPRRQRNARNQNLPNGIRTLLDQGYRLREVVDTLETIAHDEVEQDNRYVFDDALLQDATKMLLQESAVRETQEASASQESETPTAVSVEEAPSNRDSDTVESRRGPITRAQFREAMRRQPQYAEATDTELDEIFDSYRQDVEADGDIRFSMEGLETMLNMPWREQYANRDNLPENSAVYIRETPAVVRAVGLRDLALTMTTKHAKAATSGVVVDDPHAHHVTDEVVEQLPELMERPVMVLDSNTVPGDIMVVLDALDTKGNPVVATVHPNGHAQVGGEKGRANFITSVYGRDNLAVRPGSDSKNNLLYLLSRPDKRGVLYWNRELAEELFQKANLRVPNFLQNLPSDTVLKMRARYNPNYVVERGVFDVSEEEENNAQDNRATHRGSSQRPGRTSADGGRAGRNLDHSAPGRDGGVRSEQTAEGVQGQDPGRTAPSVPAPVQGPAQETGEGPVGRGTVGEHRDGGVHRGELGETRTQDETREQVNTEDVIAVPQFKGWDEAINALTFGGVDGLSVDNPLASDIEIVAIVDGETQVIATYERNWDGLARLNADLPGLVADYRVSAAKQTTSNKTDSALVEKCTADLFLTKPGYEYTDVVLVHPTNGKKFTVHALDLDKHASAKVRKRARFYEKLGFKTLLVPKGEILSNLNRMAGGVTVRNDRGQAFILVQDSDAQKGVTTEHEGLHARLFVDYELFFTIRQALIDAGYEKTIDRLRKNAVKAWGEVYKHGKLGKKSAAYKYSYEQEVYAEALAGNPGKLGDDILAIQPIVQAVVEQWDAQFKAARKQQPRGWTPEHNQPNAFELEWGYNRDWVPDIDEDSTRIYDSDEMYDRPEYADPMYSKLYKVVQEYKGDKIGASSLVSYLSGHGVKGEEVKWSGIGAFLEGKKSVTKDEVLQFLRENGLKIETEVLTNGPSAAEYVNADTGASYSTRYIFEQAARGEAANLGLDPDQVDIYTLGDGSLEAVAWDGSREITLLEAAPGDAAKWAEHTVRGGANYREELFRLPGGSHTNLAMNTHWGRTGVLAHARMQDFTTYEGGKRVLFIEEIQSDWHNEARTVGGYATEENQRKLSEVSQKLEELMAGIENSTEYGALVYDLATDLKLSGIRGDATAAAENVLRAACLDNTSFKFEATSRYGVSPDVYDRVVALTDRVAGRVGELTRERGKLQKVVGGGVPDAPFSKTYHEYVLKHILREAAEGGYDYVAWTTGKMQEQRWGSKFAEGYRIEYDQDIPKFLNKYGKQWGAKVEDVQMVNYVSDFDGAKSYITVPGINITDSMRESVLYEGQPMFELDPKQQAWAEKFNATHGEGAAEAVAAAVTDAFFRAQEEAKAEPVTASSVGSNAQLDEDLLGWVTYTAKPSVGAADYDFDPYSRMEFEYGTIEPTGKNNHRWVEAPRSTNGVDRVSQAAPNIMSAKATPESRLGAIAGAVVDGKLSHNVKTDAQASNRARRRIRKNGFDSALAEWRSDVDQGRTSKDLVAMGAILLNNAGNSDMSGEAYVDLLVDYSDLLTRAGQALQAAKLFKNLTPESRLYALQRTLSRMNRHIDPKENVSVDEWMKKVGDQLASRLVKRATSTTKKAEAKTVCQIILSDLTRYANEHLAKEETPGLERTEMDRILDLFHNYEHYTKALEEAKQTVLEKYGRRQDIMNFLNEWGESELDYTRMLTNQLLGTKEVTMPRELADEYLRAETDEAREAAMDKILGSVAAQIPASLMDKFTALRYTSMLGNLKTALRNTTGNVVMRGAVLTKTTIAGLAEALLERYGVNIERTTSVHRDQETLDAAEAEFKKVKDIIAKGGRYGDESSNLPAEIRDRQRIFKTEAFEKARKGVKWLMDNQYFGDYAFSYTTFKDSLARYIAANHTTWSQASEELKTKALEKAVTEAAEATFRDQNAVSDAVVRIRFRNPKNWVEKGVNMVGEGVLPFRRTPANIAVRMWEYSPLGFAATAVEAVRAKKGLNNMTGADIVNELAKNTTGTILMLVGLGLAAAGALKAGAPDDEKEKELWEMQGHQEYSLEIGGVSYTIDWAAPTATAMFLGAALYEAFSEDGVSVRDMAGLVGRVFDPMLEMSMLQGVDDALSNAQTYGDDSALVRFVGNALWSYVSQPVPTLLGQLERSLSNKRMTTYADKNKDTPDGIQRSLGKTSAKVPGWDYAQVEYVDAWGRTQKNASNWFLNVIEQFISPGYANTITESDMEKELLRLYGTTGESSVLISNAPKYFTVDNQRVDLTAAEYLTYAKTRGQTAYQLMTELTSSAAYQALSDEQKVRAVQDVYELANQTAKNTVTAGKTELDGWVKEAQASAANHGVAPQVYIAAKAAVNAAEGVKDKKTGKTVSGSKSMAMMLALYEVPGLSDAQRKDIAEDLGIGKEARGLSKGILERRLKRLQDKNS